VTLGFIWLGSVQLSALRHLPNASTAIHCSPYCCDSVDSRMCK